MTPYVHQVQYYETDKMGITYHGNYIHWMEEARIAFLNDLGYSYARLESEGVGSPVTGISCKYIASTTFPDQVAITVKITSFNGVQLTLSYEMRKVSDDTLVMTSTSEHVFLGTNGRFVRLKRDYPEFYQILADNLTPAE